MRCETGKATRESARRNEDDGGTDERDEDAAADAASVRVAAAGSGHAGVKIADVSAMHDIYASLARLVDTRRHNRRRHKAIADGRIRPRCATGRFGVAVASFVA